MALAGVVLTAVASWAAWRLDRSNERTLLGVQTRQAAALISSAIGANVRPLQEMLAVAAATGGDPGRFRSDVAPYVVAGGQFADVSLWRVGAGAPTQLGASGSAAKLPPPSIARLAVRAAQSPTFLVRAMLTGRDNRVAYAVARSGYVVYAERVIPRNRRVPIERDAAFSDLYFATYVGRTTDTSALGTTNVALDHLPMTGMTVRVFVPFGNSTVTLVTKPIDHLGGRLAARLPWIFLASGLAITALTAFAVAQLVRRRRSAEAAAKTIKSLYEQLDESYGQQRSASLTLQHALLPRTNPVIDGVDFASAYVAGDSGLDIGGDWYSVIPLSDTGFGFVVGDVSGRGIDAAAIMARCRFTLRAYLREGHPPERALAMVADDLDIMRDGHLATVLVGVGDICTRSVTLANAGHLEPLIIDGAGLRFAKTAVGPPLGVGAVRYAATTITMEPGAMLLAFTDGLVERRHEDIDVGLTRLAAAVSAPAESEPGSVDRSLDAWLAGIVERLTGSEATPDDVAILALRWATGEPAAARQVAEEARAE